MTLTKLSKKDFNLLRNTDTKAYKTKNLLFFYSESPENSDFRYGFTVTKKKIKLAVGRNRIKRLLRECVKKALNEKEPSNSYRVNIVYAPKSNVVSAVTFNDLYKDVELFFRKAI